jgi:hypothetical protein
MPLRSRRLLRLALAGLLASLTLAPSAGATVPRSAVTPATEATQAILSYGDVPHGLEDSAGTAFRTPMAFLRAEHAANADPRLLTAYAKSGFRAAASRGLVVSKTQYWTSRAIVTRSPEAAAALADDLRHLYASDGYPTAPDVTSPHAFQVVTVSQGRPTSAIILATRGSILIAVGDYATAGVEITSVDRMTRFLLRRATLSRPPGLADLRNDGDHYSVAMTRAGSRAAHAATLTSADLKTHDDWRAGLISVPADAPGVACPDFNPRRSDLTITGLAYTQFSAHGTWFAGALASVFASPSMLRREMARIGTGTAMSCEGRASAAAADARFISAAAVSLPAISCLDTAYRFIYDEGPKLRPFVEYYVVLHHGSTEVIVYATAPVAQDASARDHASSLARMLGAKLMA